MTMPAEELEEMQPITLYAVLRLGDETAGSVRTASANAARGSAGECASSTLHPNLIWD